MDREALASRLTLNCTKNTIRSVEYDQYKISLVDTVDDVILPHTMRQQVYDLLPHAHQAFIHNGGDFPFLSVPEFVNIHIITHMRRNGYFPNKEEILINENKHTFLDQEDEKEGADVQTKKSDYLRGASELVEINDNNRPQERQTNEEEEKEEDSNEQEEKKFNE